MSGVQHQHFAIQQLGKPGNQRCATRRALINLCGTRSNGLRIGQAARIAAASALGLRQLRVDFSGPNLTHGQPSAVAQWSAHVNGICGS